MKSLSKLFSDVIKSVSSSGIQFGLTLLSTPIMTRLYHPVDYATFGIISSAALTLVGVGLVSLPDAYPAEKEPAARTELMQTMFTLLPVLVVFSIFAAMGVVVTGVVHGSVALALFPVLVLAYGVRQIATSAAIRNAHFNSTALVRMMDPVCSRGGAIGLGALFGGNPAFIILSAIVSYIAGAYIICRALMQNIFHEWRQITFNAKPVATLRRYSDFVFYNTFSQQTQPLVLLGIQMSIAAFFSGELAGHYILATSIVSLPVSLIALATAPIVYHHFIDTALKNSLALARQTTITAAIYLGVGLCIFAPIFFFGEVIFTFAFGAKWVAAGAVASALSIAYVASFATIGVQSIFRVTKRIKLHFWLEISVSIVTLCVAIYCFRTMPFNSAIWWLSGTWLFRNFVLLCAAVVVANQYDKKEHD